MLILMVNVESLAAFTLGGSNRKLAGTVGPGAGVIPGWLGRVGGTACGGVTAALGGPGACTCGGAAGAFTCRRVRELAVPTSIISWFSSLISGARTMCGISANTVSVSRFSLVSEEKKYLRNGIWAS